MLPRIPATVTVLTYNSERTLEKCLASVAAFAEVLVLDGGSTDGTREIAQAHGARVEAQSDQSGPIMDFSAVRERSFTMASHDWIFWLDSDEWADETLLQSIHGAIEQNDSSIGYRAERMPVIGGTVIRYAYFMPDRNLRLVNRKTAAWAKGKRVHEHLRMNAGTTVHDLAGAIFTPWADLATYAKRDRYYLNLAFSKPLERRPSLFITVKSVMKNIGFAFGIVCSAVYLSLRYGFTGAVLPWRYHLRFARYHLFVARERLRQFFLAKNYAPPAA